jgi:hypothetical protein
MTISTRERGIEIIKTHEKNIHSELPFKEVKEGHQPHHTKSTYAKREPVPKR